MTTGQITIQNPEGDVIRVSAGEELAPVAVFGDQSELLSVRISVAEQGPPGPYDINVHVVTEGEGDIVIDYSQGGFQTLTLTGNVDSIAVAHWPPPGKAARLILEVRNGGSFQIATWPEGTLWPEGDPPTFTTGANACDLIVLTTGTAGERIFGNVVGQNYLQSL